MKQRAYFTFLTYILFAESHSPALCLLELTCSWESQAEHAAHEARNAVPRLNFSFTFCFFLFFFFVGRRPLWFSVFLFLHNINACNHLLVTNAQIYSRSLLFLFCFVRVVSVSFSFILPVYTATEFGRRLGFAVPHLFVAVVNRTEPDLSK